MPSLHKLLYFAVAAYTISSQAVPASATADVATSKASPAIRTKNGTYVGRYLPEYEQDLFLGIPYAQPPVGDLRFRVPQSLNSSFTGKRTVTELSAECVGYGSSQLGYVTSEDCLYLNVVRPAGIKAGTALPVVIWIHGGGFIQGSGSDLRYNLSFIVANSVEIGMPMIGVSINYRLSVWGFLASSELAGTGNLNLGLRDQRLALHWVHENIAKFGGDPSKVTLWGQSAGANSIGYHLTAYNGRDDGLFRAAIMESGGPISFAAEWTAEHNESQYTSLVNAVNCTPAIDTLGCLRRVPFATLNAVINTTEFIAPSRLPVIDGDFLTTYGSVLLSRGQYVHVPIIYGGNTDEGTTFGPVGVNTAAEFAQGLENSTIVPNVNLQPSIAQLILDAYPDNPCIGIPATLNCTRLGLPYGAEYRRTSAYAGDTFIIAPRRLTCQTWARAGVPAYCYRYNGWTNGLTAYSGVNHFAEVGLVMYNTMGVGYHVTPNPFGNRGPEFFALAKLMSCSWASFVGSLDPNKFREKNDTAVPLWPVYKTKNPKVIVWESNVTTHLEPDNRRAKAIETIISLSLAFHR